MAVNTEIHAFVHAIHASVHAIHAPVHAIHASVHAIHASFLNVNDEGNTNSYEMTKTENETKPSWLECFGKHWHGDH